MNFSPRPSPKISLLLFAVVGLCGATLHAALTLGSPFTDHMVVQHDKPLVVWGWDTAGVKVTVSLESQSASATVSEDGAWRAEVQPPKAGGPYELVVAGSSEVRCKDVLSGEVWLATGQSNMVLPMRDVDSLNEALETADNPNIRFFQINRTPADAPAKTVDGAWVPGSRSALPLFSGVAYYFAQKLQSELHVPVGIIESDWGGSSILAWLPDEVMKALPDYEAQRRAYEMRSTRYQAAMKEWESKGKAGPHPPTAGGEVQQGLSILDNGMTHAVKPYPIKGVIWYQGEANAPQAANYKKWFAALVESWRKDWADSELPVYFAQLPGFDRPVGKEHWPAFRNAQRELAREIPHTDVAVFTEAGDPDDIHPKNKKIPGQRLAQLALAETYRRDIVPGGPLPESAALQGGKVEVRFTRTGGGLELREEGETAALLLVDRSGKTEPAPMKLAGETVTAEVPVGFQPVVVRYAWEGFPTLVIYNKEGFPASPFELKLTP